MPPRLLETRELLAPFLGQWVRCRGTLMRDAIMERRESHGRADLQEFVGELVTIWGWDRVADAVEAAHGSRP